MGLERLGLQKTTLVDYPGEVAATLFTAGCNLSCPYCHNPELVSGVIPQDFLTREQIMSFLRRRAGVLGAVCITGGEPTMQPDLPRLISEIHELGLKVKIDTNGTLPDHLEALEVEYIAMDIKTAPSKYGRVGTAQASARIRRSIEAVRRLGTTFEFRTTVVPGVVDNEDIDEICESLEEGDSYTLAQFRPLVTLDPSYRSVAPYPREVLETMRERCARGGVDVHIRSQ